MINHKKASQYFPEAYQGNVNRGGINSSVIDVATDLGLDTILRRFGDWVLTTQGIDCLTKKHFIAKDQLDKEDWVQNLGKQSWVNESDFSLIYYSAKDLARLGVI